MQFIFGLTLSNLQAQEVIMCLLHAFAVYLLSTDTLHCAGWMKVGASQ